MNQPGPQYGQPEPPQYPPQPVNQYDPKVRKAQRQGNQQPYAAVAGPNPGWQQSGQDPAWHQQQPYAAPAGQNPAWQHQQPAPQQQYQQPYAASAEQNQGWQQQQPAVAWQQPPAGPAPQQPYAAPADQNPAWQHQQQPGARPAPQQPYTAPADQNPAWQHRQQPAAYPPPPAAAAPQAWHQQQPGANPAPSHAAPADANPAWQHQQPAAAYAPAPPTAPGPAWQQSPAPIPAWQQPAAPQYPAAPYQSAPYQSAPGPNPAYQQQPQQAPAAPAPHGYLPQPPAQSVSFPPPPNLSPPRDRLVEGATPFLEPGETVYYGFILKLDDTIPETPRELMIAIEGQHRVLGGINRADKKIGKGLKWALNPMDAASERLAEKGREALDRKLAGPVFLGGWESQAGWFIRYARATREDYGPGSWGVLTDRRYLVFRAGRAGGSSMRLVHAVPRTLIAGVRTEGTKDAALHGRTPRAELHFTDGSMVATMMATKQAQQVAAILAVQQQQHQPPRH